ncbi:MAG: DNA primase [Pseudomonadota bacterium]
MKRDRSAIQAIKAKLNLVDIARRHLELRRMGNRWFAPCPFHQESTPSFSINEEEGLFYCFGCQASGDIFDFYGRMHGLDFRETIEQLADEAGITLDQWKPDPQAEQKQSLRRQCLRMYEVATAHFKHNLSEQMALGSAECRDYIKRRGLSDAIVQDFELGWSLPEWHGLGDALRRASFSPQQGVQAGLLAPSDRGQPYDRFRGRLIFPIKNLAGHIIAFGGRIIGGEDQAKYINSTDTPLYKKGENLYGLFQARRSISQLKSAMLTEGYMDVLTLHQFGYTNAVGVLGTALTPDQVKRLGGFCSMIDLLFDGDNAGRKAALKSCEMMLARGMKCRVVLMPQGEDIDSLLRSAGKEAFEKLRENAPDGLAFCIQSIASQSPADMIAWTKEFLAQVESPELLSYFITRITAGLGLNEAQVRENVSSRSTQSSGAQAKTAVPQHRTSCDRELMTFTVRYPHCLPILRDARADLSLEADWARTLWAKIEHYGSEDVFEHLSEREKTFWVRCRTGEVPPLNNEQGELSAVLRMLDGLQMKSQSASCMAALRQTGGMSDPEADIELLRALQETLGRSNE